MQEKKFFRIVNGITDWIFRIIVINLLVISTSLFIFTIIPSITAAYKLYTIYLNNEHENVFKGYFKFFKEEFTNKTVISVLYTIILILIGLSLNFYLNNIKVSNFNALNYIAVTIIIAFGILTIASLIFIPLAFIVTDVQKIDYIIKLSIRLSLMYLHRTLMLIVSMFLPLLLLLSPFTELLLIFSGISLGILLNAGITIKHRELLQKLGDDDNEN